MRYVRTLTVNNDDWWMVLSFIPLGIRIALAHLILIWGTNNINLDGFDAFRVGGTAARPGEGIQWGLDEEIRRREKGSRVVLGARVAYVALYVRICPPSREYQSLYPFLTDALFCISIWSQKLCITEFHNKLNLSFFHRNYKTLLVAIRWGLLATFVGVVISIWTECHPTAQ